MSSVQPLLRIVLLKITVGAAISNGYHEHLYLDYLQYDIILNQGKKLEIYRNKKLQNSPDWTSTGGSLKDEFYFDTGKYPTCIIKLLISLSDGEILYSWFLKRLYYSEQQRRIVLQVQEYNILCDNWTNVILEICFLVITDITEHFRKYFLEILKGFMT